jgi:hypothetical protein
VKSYRLTFIMSSNVKFYVKNIPINCLRNIVSNSDFTKCFDDASIGDSGSKLLV